jgi:NAD-dependent aldehyde dehydrogenases
MTVEIINPATGQVTYRHELMGAADIEQRLQAAADAFPGWADHSLQDRGAILRQIAAQLRARRDDLQQAMTHEMGKLKAEALAEVDKCAAACEYYADHAADYLKPQLIDTEAQRSYVRYEPIGCVFAVMPWNSRSGRCSVSWPRRSWLATWPCSSTPATCRSAPT